MNQSDTKHADFTWEQTYSRATLDIAVEFVADLDAEFDAPERGSAEAGGAVRAMPIKGDQPC